MKSILLAHARRYPGLEPADAVKLLYQSEFGGGHLIRDEQSCLQRLQEEYRATLQQPGLPLTEDIGGGIVRVNLAALDAHGLSPEALGEMFLRSAAIPRGSMAAFRDKLALLTALTASGEMPFSCEDLRSYLSGYEAAGSPPVSHSEAYRKHYRPAYRVVQSCHFSRQEVIPVNTKTNLYILTGFLGSGKTTLLLKILEHLRGHRVGIIQNEFGKLSIDGDILRNDDIRMVEITRGSIFCTCLKLNFVSALAEMARQDFEYLFVESSGLGDPSNVSEILEAARVVSGREFHFRGTVCMVDGLHFLSQIETEEAARRQIKHCHLAAVTKTDLVDATTLETITETIRAINPLCRLEESRMGGLSPDFLQENLLLYQWAEDEEALDLRSSKPKTLFLNFEGEAERDALISFLRPLCPSLYRAKGFFRIRGEGWQQVDVVGSRIDLRPCAPCDLSQLVFISRIGPAVIKEILSAWQTHVGLPMQLKN